MDDFLVSVGSLGIAIILLIIALAGVSCRDSSAWNNGYHTCGGQWQYVQAVGHAHFTGYIYECDKCGKTIEIYKKK